MTRILTLTKANYDRLVHEKARLKRGAPLHWVRWYLDTIDDAVLQREPPLTRLVARDLPVLIARSGWSLPYEPRWIASRLSLRPEDVKRAIERLIALGYIVEIDGEISETGTIQPSLFGEPIPERHLSEARATSERSSSDLQPTPRAVTEVSAQINDSLALAASQPLGQTRARAEERREELSSNGTVASSAATDAHADEDEREIVNRLAALAARGDPRSAGTIRHWSIGAPDYIIARALESYRGRQPRPTNGGGYVVATLQSLRREAGIPDPPRIDREPAL